MEDSESPNLRHALRALIVNDCRVEQAILVGSLRALGVESLVANNAEEALEIIYEGAIVDLIIMDKDMPVMDDGIHATRRLRAMGVTAKILGIITFYTREAVLDFLYAGADDVVLKPVKIEKLISILEEINNDI
ncbi:putative histidine kinase response regulator and transcription factor RR-A-type family [Dioscorea sansibarensis]